jgi:HD-GYP domain-containing protein (c-di-GMP phosphodiesterase class II)
MVAALGAALRTYHPPSAAHCRRAALTAAATARTLELPVEVVHLVGTVTALHDLGKLRVPHTTLDQPTPLNGGQWEQIHRHPADGADLIGEDPAHAALASGIRAHHERWDGTGYPYGLSGLGIPLTARICAVACAWDTITRGRPYQRRQSARRAADELRAGAGSQFDPVVTEAFLAALKGAGPAPTPRG